MNRPTDVTFGDIRDGDILVDKQNHRWYVTGVNSRTRTSGTLQDIEVSFNLSKPSTPAVIVHHMTKPAGQPCRVMRDFSAGTTEPNRPSDWQAEFGHPLVHAGEGWPAEPNRPSDVYVAPNDVAADLAAMTGDDAIHNDAVATVTANLGADVLAEFTPAEQSAADAATVDAPVILPAFDTFTDLEMRSHLFILHTDKPGHGIYHSDLTSRADLIALHAKAHAAIEAGTLADGQYVPHVHEASAAK